MPGQRSVYLRTVPVLSDTKVGEDGLPLCPPLATALYFVPDNRLPRRIPASAYSPGTLTVQTGVYSPTNPVHCYGHSRENVVFDSRENIVHLLNTFVGR